MTNFFDSLPNVPGDPATVRRFAHLLGVAAETVDDHANRLGSSVASLVGVAWRSPAADRFASLCGLVANDLRSAGESYREAAGVLARYASALDQAQRARAAAQRQLDGAKVEAAVVDVALPMFAGVEDFNPAVTQAHTQADEAVRYVKLMAGAARAALETVAGLPVHRPGPAPKAAVRAARWYDRYLAFGRDFGEGLYDGFKAQAMMGWNASVGHLLVDPKGYVESLREEGDVGELAGKHPEEFAGALIDWSDWTSGHPGRAAGELTAAAATTAALGFADGDLAGGALAGASTFALGKAFCYYFQAVHQGHVPKAEDLRRYYHEQLTQAEKLWAGARNQKSEARDQKSETKNHKSEVRDHKSEVGSQYS